MRAEGRLPPRAVAHLDDLLAPSRPRRIVVFGKRKAHTRVTGHFVRGFEAQGHHVLWLRPARLRRWLGKHAALRCSARRVTAFQPELVFVYKHDAPLELLDALPPSVPRVVFYEDAPPRPDERLLTVARRASLLFTTAEGQIPELERAGAQKVLYLRSGCDPVDHGPGRPRDALRADAAFIGSAAGEARLALMRAVHSRFELRLYGAGWAEQLGIRPTRSDVGPALYRDVCASSRIVLGIDPRDDVHLYFSNRTWLTLGCRGFLLTRYVPGLEEFFTNHEHLVWYSSLEECLELVAHYLPREAERERIARAGHAYVHAYHSFRHATAEIVGIVFGEPWHGRPPGTAHRGVAR